MKLGAMQTDKQKLLVVKQILNIPSDLEYYEYLIKKRPTTKFSQPLQAYRDAHIKHLKEVRNESINQAQQWLFSAYESIFDLINDPNTKHFDKVNASFLIFLLYHGQIPRLYDLISNPEEVKKRYSLQKLKFMQSTKDNISNHSQKISDIEVKKSNLRDTLPEDILRAIEATLKSLDEDFNSELELLAKRQQELNQADKSRATSSKGFRSILTPFILLYKLCDPIPKQKDQVKAFVELFHILGYDDSNIQLQGIIRQWYIDAEDAYVGPAKDKISCTLRKLISVP